MDHSHMDHSSMDHGGMDHGEMCKMSVCSINSNLQFSGLPEADFFVQMLFTWDTNNLCIIFRWWHIRTTPGLIFSLLGVIALTAGYEAIRSASRKYEAWIARRQEEAPSKLPLPIYPEYAEILSVKPFFS